MSKYLPFEITITMTHSPERYKEVNNQVKTIATYGISRLQMGRLGIGIPWTMLQRHRVINTRITVLIRSYEESLLF